ncbi:MULTISPECIES: thioester reductase domain-containing protein [unclassified Nocardia]|uniref:thioester reductase domain-containing protein n=1 Tax=unclassified Nocardia TaxID=2637762 RepID=UPI001CE409EE|nr:MULTISPECIES: thioester reductase domain-containing protein [unclassified Nocardia]
MNEIRLGSFATTVRADDPVVRDHRVHGVRILPGVVYLDTILRAAMAAGHLPTDLVIREALFHRPVALDSAGAVRITFLVTRHTDGRPERAGTVRIRIDAQRLDAAGTPVGPVAQIAECVVAVADSPTEPAVADIGALRAELGDGRALAEMYGQSGARGIEHREFMRATGIFARRENTVVAELGLGAEAGQHLPGFLLHPTFLDASTIVPFVDPARLGVDDESAFIPIYFGKVRAWRATPERVYVRATVRGGGTDLLQADVAVWGADGAPIAEYELTSKRVRGSADIERLVAAEPARVAMATVADTTEVADTGDPRSAITADLVLLVSAELGLQATSIATDVGFYELGLDSGRLLRLTAELEARVGEPLYPTLLFEYQTIDALAGHLAEKVGGRYRRAEPEPAPGREATTVSAEVPAARASAAGMGEAPSPTPPPAASPDPSRDALFAFGFEWRSDAGTPSAQAPDRLLVFDTAERPYRGEGAALVRVRPGFEFAADATDFVIDPANPTHIRQLLVELSTRPDAFDAAVYLWGDRLADVDYDPQLLIDQVYLPLRELVRAIGELPDAPVRRILAVFDDGRAGESGAAMIGGFARTLRLEQPHPVLRSVCCDSTTDAATVVRAELAVAQDDPATEIRYRNGGRETRQIREIAAAIGDPSLADGAVAVITGGFGGIGGLLARRLAARYRARLVLVSRRPLDATGARLLAEITELGGEAVHVRADLAVAADVDRIAAITRATYGRIGVVYHGAGELRDGLVAGAGAEAAKVVLAPKVCGVEWLAAAMPDAGLLVLFSSVSAVLGNPGQADYAAANRYLDVTAERPRDGGPRVVAIGWPLWAEGGMLPPREHIDALRRAGVGLLPTEIGLDLLLAAGTGEYAHTAYVWGDPAAIRARLRPVVEPAAADMPAAANISRPATENAIAIVGYSGRYPDADDVDEFWRNLRDGHDAVGPVPARRWWLANTRGKPFVGGFLRDVAGFDPMFFRIPPAHAPLLDPQERLFLQQAYGALEHAGYHHDEPAVRDRRVGVYVGTTWSDYRLLGVEASRSGDPVAVASIPSSIANRTSYTLGLRGPSLTVDTACSASLTALHLARRALLAGECDAALVGGVNLLLHEDKFRLLSGIGMLSESGRCQPFAAGADGYVPGEGVGALYLKPLRSALADGDTIHGLILGSAVNHGGQTAGYSVPHPVAQAEVIAEALDEAGLASSDIDYLEAHGTGTALGDPIEIAGLAMVFGHSVKDARPRALGATKSSIGHLEAAAGVAGLTRILLQFRHGRIAPTLHAAQPNPAIAFHSTPFQLPRELQDWPQRTSAGVAQPRRAGISAFGAGGANAHVVLAEFVDDRVRPVPSGAPEIFVLSARSAERLRHYAGIMAEHFRTLDPADFTDAVRTLRLGRPALAHRLALVATTPAAVAAALDGFRAGEPGAVFTGEAESGVAQQPSGTSDTDLARAWVTGAAIDWARHGAPSRRVPLPGYPFDQRDYWILDRPRTDFDSAVAEFERVARRGGVMEPGQPELNRYAAVRLYGVLFEMGLTIGEWPVWSVREMLGVRTEYQRLLTSCLDILYRHGLVERADDRLRVIGPPPGSAWMRADLLARFPGCEAYVALLDSCLDSYQRVLRGEMAATEVLFPRGELELVSAIYRGNTAYDFANGLLADLIGAVARGRTGDRPLRVLEIGAGTGGSTHAALAALSGSGVAFEYHYTDIAASFVAHGRRTFADEPRMRFGVLDIEADAAAQGFPAGCADLILCANVLHAVGEIGPTLGRIRRLLAPGGVLAFTEVTTDLEVLALTFGLLDGWHGYRDPELRIVNSPLLSEDQWRSALMRAGFSGIHAWGPGLCDDAEPSFRLLAAWHEMAAGELELDDPRPADAAFPATKPAVVDDIPRQAVPEALQRTVIGIVAAGLGIAPDEVRPEQPLSEYGVDSILAVKIVERVNDHFTLALRPTVVFDYPTARALAQRVAQVGGAEQPRETSESSGRTADIDPTPAAPPKRAEPSGRTAEPEIRQDRTESGMDIAIIGMSGRFPGAADLDEFWRNLASGVDSVTEVPPSRWPIADYFRPGPATPGKTYSKWGGFLDDVGLFDPAFFDLVPTEADHMDPQQRLFLEHSWLALEDAGIDPRSLRRKRCGVFAGAPGSDYATLLRNRATFGSHHMFTGNSPAILPARVAYHLDLTGPCMGLDTACSSALVAVHQACRSLLSGESELALAGGVAVFVTPEYHLLASSMGMLSAQGRCAAFGADADGFVIAEGVGVVVLKPLAAAERDGDPIHGIIRGTGVNHDGRTNGITAPSARSQTELELEVYRAAGIDPATIGYVETHGTGTRLGDPIEIEALTAAFRRYTDSVATIPVGSVKSNIGHASHAAGMAGLFKVLLAMRAGKLPPTLHADMVNPLLELDNSPFFVNTETRDWPAGTRRAAVSSFGFSGTNAHLVVDDYPAARIPAPHGEIGGAQVVVLSARTATSLVAAARTLRRSIAAHPEWRLADIAHTLAFGRSAFEHRLAVVAESVDGLAARLADFADGDHPAGVFSGVVPEVAAGSVRTLTDPVAAARAWVEGADVEFAPWSHDSARRLHLPGYRFDREHCWVPDVPVTETVPAETVPETTAEATPSPAKELWRVAEDHLKGLLAEYCRLDPARIRTRIPLQDYGIDSVLISKLNDRLVAEFGELPSTLFFEYQTLRELAGYFADMYADRLTELTGTRPAPVAVAAEPVPATTSMEPVAAEDDIAIVGMAGRFPMAHDIDEFWANLVAGRDCIVEVPPQRWDHGAYLSDDPDEPGTTYARWGGFLDDVDKFDARFFGITPKDAEEMDPQQRLFLETSWAALEDAGYPPDRLRASAAARGLVDAGVFVGVGYAEYQAFVNIPISGYFAVANRVSYQFGFHGPSLAVDTACSASLTALHLACESLRRGESAYALAGGVNVSIHPGKYLLLGYGRWASSDGRCRTFGAGGDGYVPGEGVVTLVLKPLRHARADGDRIYGVIRGSAINHGGRTNGFTVPNPAAQAELIERALTVARVDARDIGYVEAHGTGTALGDPIEIAALTRAYRRTTPDRGYCGIGSAKSSVGHLEAAAGAAGVVKALLQLRENTIAPNLHSDPPNPGIDFAVTPFRVIETPTEWPRPSDGSPRLTAVSSFGAGGGNAHVIVSDAEPPAPREPEDGARVVVLSARDAERLAEAATRLAQRLRAQPIPLADVAWTLAVGRAPFEHRLAVVATSTAELVELLDAATGPGARPAEGLAVFHGVARTHRDADELAGESDADRAELAGLLRSGNLPRLAELWASGWTVDWERLYGNAFGRIVSLPGYPFARRRHWIVPQDYRRRGEPPQIIAKTVVAQPTEPVDMTERRNGHRTNGVGHRDEPTVPEVEAAERQPDTAPQPTEAENIELRTTLCGEIRDIFADLTKSNPADLDLDAEFIDFGFDSVATVRMLNRLMKHYDVRIPADSTERYPTIASLADYLVRDGIVTGTPTAGKSAIETSNVVAAADIPVLTLDAPIPVATVFVTGVTGVLGGKLLHDLLAHSDVRITCLVRGTSQVAAERRIQHFLRTYDPDGALDEAYRARVTAVLGDVSQDRFGLDEPTWQRISAETDLTVHAAGRTTLVTFYDALAPINVEGTRRAVEFALGSRGRYLVYVSSFSALGDRLNFNNPPFTERDLELGQGYDHLPYQQTKYESEKLIRAASERGLRWDIVRPGNIMGDSVTGQYPFSEVSVKGAYYDILKTMIETGETMLTPVHWDITPVDYVSAAIVHIALHRPTYRETYHLTNPDIKRYYDVVRYVQKAGYDVTLVPLEEFHRRATEREIYRLGTGERYDSQTLEMFKYGIELFGTIHYEESSYADCAYTRRVLGAAGIDCPPVEELVRVYLKHCTEVGYLPEPGAATGSGPSVEAAR